MQNIKFSVSLKAIRIIGISICVGFTIVAVFLIAFHYHTYTTLKKRFEQKNYRLTNLEGDIRKLNTLLANYKEEREQLEPLLFSDKDIASFLDKISDFAKTAKIKIVDMKTQRFSAIALPPEIKASVSAKEKEKLAKGAQEKAGPELVFIPINMVIEAPFERIFDFLISLEQYRQLLTLSNVGIRLGAYPLLNCHFTLRLYSLRQLEEITGQ
jgi:hypothetical protein